jgi:CHAT domain-containing protein
MLRQLATSGQLAHHRFIHLATHAVIDDALAQRSAIIVTQVDLPDPLAAVLDHQPLVDGRISVDEIRREWRLDADLVTLSACETALGTREGGEGLVGFTQALLLSGADTVCLSLWEVDDTATALLMDRLYANLLGQREGLTSPLSKADALREAQQWLRQLTAAEAARQVASMTEAVARGAKESTTIVRPPKPPAATSAKAQGKIFPSWGKLHG